MSDQQRTLLQALRDGTRHRLANGRRRAATWLRRVAPAAVLLRLTVGLAYFVAAELAVPAGWAASGPFLLAAAAAATYAALAPGGPAPFAASILVIASWLATSALYESHGAGAGAALPVAALLYTGHSAAAVSQRFRATTAVDGEIILTWVRHLGTVLVGTVSLAVVLTLFTSHFAAVPATVAVSVGVLAALTVIYVLARSLHTSARGRQN